MHIKKDAWEHIEEKLRNKAGGSQKDRDERRAHLIRKQMETEDGREFLWEFVACSQALRMKAYTGNADCYYILGKRSWAEDLLGEAKRSNLTMYHKMETEALKREDIRKKEEK